MVVGVEYAVVELWGRSGLSVEDLLAAAEKFVPGLRHESTVAAT